MKKWMVLGVVLGSVALAQPYQLPSLQQPPVLQDAGSGTYSMEQVANEIDTARRQILIYSPVQLQHKRVAEALRLAMVDRSVKVYLFAPEEALKGGYFLSTTLAGASTFVFKPSGKLGAPVIVIDNSRMFQGKAMFGPTSVDEDNSIVFTRNPSKLSVHLNWFVKASKSLRSLNLYSNARDFARFFPTVKVILDERRKR